MKELYDMIEWPVEKVERWCREWDEGERTSQVVDKEEFDREGRHA